MNRDKVHSYHNFLFPFKWELKGSSDKVSLSKRADLSKIEHCIDFNYWEKFKFDFEATPTHHTYNDYFYFYEAVRDVLNKDYPHKIRKQKKANKAIAGLQYQYPEIKLTNAKFIIEIKEDKTFELDINDILLNFYENGVGVFTFQLYNTAYSLFDDILKINEYGRRICPQFLGNQSIYTDATKGSFLANKILLENINSPLGLNIIEDFSYYNLETHLRQAPFKIPNHIQYLLGEKFSGDEDDPNAEVIFTPILDDRMFVMSYWINDEKCLELKAKDNENNDEPSYKNADEWYRYVFVDTGFTTCQSREMMRDLLTKATYSRWISNLKEDDLKKPDCQLFGLTRYSFNAIVNNDFVPKEIVSTHFQNMYFELTLLCLIQRAYVVNFGNEIARITALIEESQSNLSSLKQDISNLYLLYIKFVNRVFFREVTPQEQGIELYTLLQKQMNLKQDMEDLGKEINELNNYVETYEQGYLNKIATLFLPIGLFAGLLGINTIDNYKFNEWSWTEYVLETLSVVLFIITLFITIYFIFKYFKLKLKR